MVDIAHRSAVAILVGPVDRAGRAAARGGRAGRARTVLAVLACLVLAGCGGPAPVAGGVAAEPAEAPEARTPPAGTVVTVGAAPEGLVADPATHLVAVAVRDPARLDLVDGRDGTTVGEVSLPGTVRHLQLAAPGGPVLVPVEGSGRLVTIGLPGGAVLGDAATGAGPHDATAAANGQVFVADEAAGSVTVLDGERVVATLDGPAQPGGIAAAGNLVGVIDVRGSTLTVLDAVSRTGLATVPAGDGPTHLVADRRGRLILTDTRGDALLTYELTPQVRVVDSVPLPGRPYGIAYDPVRDRLWVTLTDRNEPVGLDLAAGTPVEIARLPTVGQANSVAVDSATGRVFVAGVAGGNLALVDPPL